MSFVYVVPFFDTEGPSDCGYNAEKGGHPNWGKAREWDEIEQGIEKIVNPAFRQAHTGSNGTPIKYNWSWLDWIGFSENPRHQYEGFHAVYDHLKDVFGKNMKAYDDGEALHYHNPRPDRSWAASSQYPFEQWNTKFEKQPLNEILAHHLIDRNWFPVVFRAGGTIEDNALSSFLEDYIPLDFSSRGGDVIYPENPKDNVFLIDWRGTPNDWSQYHPDQNDFRKAGDMKRSIFMSLDHGKFHSLELFSKEKVFQAFHRAAEGKPTIISYFSHDFVPEKKEVIEQAHEWIVEAAKEFGIEWSYENAISAVKKAFGKTSSELPRISVDPDARTVIADKELFGLPFVAVTDGNEKYKSLPVAKKGDSFVIQDGLKGKAICISATDTDFNNTIAKYDFRR